MNHACVLALVLSSGACGSDSHPAADAPAPIDAAPDATTMGVVTLTIKGTTVVKQNVPVSFADVHGAVIAQTMTDATGAAHATVDRGASVTFLYNTALVTVTDLHPGDNLDIDVNNSDTPTPFGSVDVTFASTFATAASYSVSDGGESKQATPPTATHFDLDSHSVETSYDLLAYALDATGKPLAFTGATALVPPGASNNVAVQLGSWRTDFDTYTLGFSNVPASATIGKVALTPARGHRRYLPTQDQKAVTNAGVGLTAVAPKGGFTGWSSVGALTTADGKALIEQVTNTTTLAGLATVDATTMLPLVHDQTIALTAGRPMPTVGVTADAPLTAANGVIWEFGYTTATGMVTEILVTPPGASFELPQLGDNLAKYRPAMPFVGTLGFVYVVNGPLWTDANDFRAHWWRTLHDDLVTSVAGTTNVAFTTN